MCSCQSFDNYFLFLRVEGARKGSENGPLQRLVDGMIKYVVFLL